MNGLVPRRNALGAGGSLCYAIGCLLMTAFLTGCSEVHRGYYLALKPDAGWRMSRDANDNFFRYPTKNVPSWFVQIGDREKGKIYVTLGSHAFHSSKIWDFVKFPNPAPIQIVFHDNRMESTVLDHSRLPFAQDLYVGDSEDFTIVLPAFEVGENKIPSLSAHLRWTNGRYVVWVPLQ